MTSKPAAHHQLPKSRNAYDQTLLCICAAKLCKLASLTCLSFFGLFQPPLSCAHGHDVIALQTTLECGPLSVLSADWLLQTA